MWIEIRLRICNAFGDPYQKKICHLVNRVPKFYRTTKKWKWMDFFRVNYSAALFPVTNLHRKTRDASLPVGSWKPYRLLCYALPPNLGDIVKQYTNRENVWIWMGRDQYFIFICIWNGISCSLATSLPWKMILWATWSPAGSTSKDLFTATLSA